MAANEQLRNLVDQMPDPDRKGMYTQNIDAGKIEKAVAAIAEGGKENLLANLLTRSENCKLHRRICSHHHYITFIIYLRISTYM